jgi:hypothetical protein
MWLEELAWLWLPILGGLGLWMLWQLIALRTAVQLLRKRVAMLEAHASVRGNETHEVV